jgi:hypothetical protein
LDLNKQAHDTSNFDKALEFLRSGPPLMPLPDRSNFHPGQHTSRIDIDEKTIINHAKAWVKAIEDRE